MGRYVEDFSEFRGRQNCPYIQIGEQFVFENGATADENYFAEPPSDPYERIQRQLTYRRAELRNKELAYSQLQESLQQQANWILRGLDVPSVDESSFQQLADLREDILSIREQIQSLENRLYESRPDDVREFEARRRFKDEMDVRKQSEASEAIDRLAQMSL